jgi:hypothetical protein
MDPINWERGKHYFAIRCPTAQCHQTLALIESPAQPSSKENEILWKQIEGRSVCCPICTQETPIERRQIVVLDLQQ